MQTFSCNDLNSVLNVFMHLIMFLMNCSAASSGQKIQTLQQVWILLSDRVLERFKWGGQWPRGQLQGTVWAHFSTSNTKVTNVLSTMQCGYHIRLRLQFLVHAVTSCAPPNASWEKWLASMQMETRCLELLLAPRTSKPPWRSKGLFTARTITVTILASMSADDNVLFIIRVHCSFSLPF